MMIFPFYISILRKKELMVVLAAGAKIRIAFSDELAEVGAVELRPDGSSHSKGKYIYTSLCYNINLKKL